MIRFWCKNLVKMTVNIYGVAYTYIWQVLVYKCFLILKSLVFYTIELLDKTYYYTYVMILTILLSRIDKSCRRVFLVEPHIVMPILLYYKLSYNILSLKFL